MSRRKLPLTSIGSAVHSVPVSSPATTSVQPSTIERAGDALGRFIWHSVPVVKAVALGVVSSRQAEDETSVGLPWIDRQHPDFLLWHRRFEER